MDLDEIVRVVRRADATDDELGRLFTRLVHEHGRGEASRLWWAAFAARDATET